MQISIIGAGSWGTAFARLTSLNGHPTYLWARREEQAKKLRKTRENKQYLPGYRLPGEKLTISNDLPRVVKHADVIFFAVPSFAMREIGVRVNGYLSGGNVNLVNLAKGIEGETFNTMSEVLAKEIASGTILTLSGPSHAEGVHTARIVHLLADKLDIAVPITDSLYRIIYEDSSPSKEVSKLMSREFKVEKF